MAHQTAEIVCRYGGIFLGCSTEWKMYICIAAMLGHTFFCAPNIVSILIIKGWLDDSPSGCPIGHKIGIHNTVVAQKRKIIYQMAEPLRCGYCICISSLVGQLSSSSWNLLRRHSATSNRTSLQVYSIYMHCMPPFRCSHRLYLSVCCLPCFFFYLTSRPTIWLHAKIIYVG